MSTTHETEALLAHVGWVRSLASQLTRDAAAADDLAQEALVAAFERPPREPTALRSYLRALLQNLLRQGLRARDRRTARERRSSRAEAQASASESAERLATHREVVAAVESLSEPYLSTVLLRHFDELPPREIAARLRIPVKTVNTRLSRAHALLRERLDADHGGDRRSWVHALAILVGPGDTFLSRPSSTAPRLAVGVLGAGALVVLAVLLRARSGEGLRPAQGALRDSQSSQASSTTPAFGGSARERESVVEPASRTVLRGRVRTRAHAPVAGADITVRFRPADGTRLRLGAFGRAVEELGTVRSDAEGAFSLEVPSGRILDVRARAEGFGKSHRPLIDPASDLDLVLEQPATLALAVVDAAGAPVPDARVELFRSGEPESVREPLAAGPTDSTGRWSTSEAPPGVFWAQVRSDRGVSARLVSLAVRSGEVLEREVRLRASSVLEGAVVAAGTSEPVAGASLGLGSAEEVRGSTDDQGRFRVEGLDPSASSADLFVAAPGFATAEKHLDLRGSAPFRADVELTRGHAVSGALRGPGGAPVPGAWVAAYGRRAGAMRTGTDWTEVRTDAGGGFVLPALRSDLAHALFVRAPGLGTLIGRLPEGADGARIELGTLDLENGASIEGRVVRDDGSAAAGALVQVERTSDLPALGAGNPDAAARVAGPGEGVSVTIAVAGSGTAAGEAPRAAPLDAAPLLARDTIAADDGRFSFRDLAPGRYRVLARIGFLRSAPREVGLGAGGVEREMRLEIPRGLVLEGTVIDGSTRPLAGAWVLLFREGGRLEERSEETDVDGRFRIEGLEAIRYRLQGGYASSDASGILEHPFARATLDGLVPPRSDVVLRLPGTVRVEGRVVDAGGRPLARAVVDARDQEGRSYQAISDAHGLFRLQVAEGARLDLRAGWPGPGAEAADGQSRPRRSCERTAVEASAGEIVLTLE